MLRRKEKNERETSTCGKNELCKSIVKEPVRKENRKVTNMWRNKEWNRDLRELKRPVGLPKLAGIRGFEDLSEDRLAAPVMIKLQSWLGCRLRHR